MFGFIRKKTPPTLVASYPTVIVPQSSVDSKNDHAILQAIEQYVSFMTTKAGFRIEDLDPAVHMALGFNSYIGTVIEQGHGRYAVMVHNRGIDSKMVGNCLAAIGAQQLRDTHAAFILWLQKNGSLLGGAEYQIQSPDFETLDKAVSAKVEKEAYRLFKTWFTALPNVSIPPDNIWREDLKRMVDDHPQRAEIRIKELETKLFDPLTVGLHLALGTDASKTAKDLTCVTGFRIASRNHHPSDRNGFVYWVSTNIGNFLGYQDQLGVHLALAESRETKKPDTPATGALRPVRTLWTATPTEIKAAIDHAKRSDAAFATVCLLDCIGRGKDIDYISYTSLIKTGQLAGKDVALYRVTAASDKSMWFVLLSDAAAFISAPNLGNIEAIHVLRTADLKTLKRNARVIPH